MSRNAERLKDLELRSVADNDRDSLDLLAMTAAVEAFPRWPVATMATRRDAQLLKAVSKQGQTHRGY